jgi:serine/threonine-protein kinase PRP4
MPTEKATTVTTLAPPAVPAKGQEEPKNEHVRQQVNGKEGAEADEKHDTPTSQESLATTTASTAASSQNDVEVLSNVSSAREGATTKDEHESGLPAATTTKNVVLPAKVDVKSIKMDILKALADARSTIAGIKGAAPPSAVATNAPKVTSPVQRNGPDVREKAPDDSSSEDKASLPQASEIDHKIEQSALTPGPATAEKPISPQNPQVSAADVDEFDMFSAAEQHVAGLPLSPAAAPAAMVVGTAIQSNYDDVDGYYKPSVGEILHGEYRVLGTVGKGVFSTVLRCQRMSSTSTSADPEIVAIKLIRNNDIMREAAQTEIKILTHLSERDPRDKKHCVRLLDRFEHRNHVALVFESMQMNVREAMKKFGGKGGISIQAVRIFCRHLLVALSHLDSSGIVHAGRSGLMPLHA